MPKKREQRVVTRNLSLYPEDVTALRQVSKKLGLSSLSAAARYIIRDWQRLKGKKAEQGVQVRR